jgi:hypothetical protein
VAVPADPWFFYGLPAAAALIQRDNGRIWMVTNEPDLIDQFCTLFHSKIELMRVDIRTCSNFADDLIDNTVCTDWYVDWPDIADRPLWYSHADQSTRLATLDNTRNISGSRLENHPRSLDILEKELKNQLMLLHFIRSTVKHFILHSDDVQIHNSPQHTKNVYQLIDNIVATELTIEDMYEPIKTMWFESKNQFGTGSSRKLSPEIALVMNIQPNQRLYD